MNRMQRLILVVGAVAIVAAIAAAPRLQIIKGTYLRASDKRPSLAQVIDVRTLAAYLLGVLGATALLYRAASSGAGGREERPSSPRSE